MMMRFVCAVAVALMAANVTNAAALEQDDWGFSVENGSGSSYSAGPSFQTFGPQTFGPQSFRPNTTFRAPRQQYGQPVYGVQPYYTAPYYPANTAPRTFGPQTGGVQVYRAPAFFGFN